MNNDMTGPTVLLYTRTDVPHHPNIPVGSAAVNHICTALGCTLVATEDPSVFTDESLRAHLAVVFLNTAGDQLNESQRLGMTGFVRDGGGFVGIHAASYFEIDWPWYESMLGARFSGHPEPQHAIVRVADRTHPATLHLPAEWARFDEWYNFRALPQGAHVMATVDESTYSGGAHGSNHPVIWCRELERGRSFYTALGHTEECFADADYLNHLAGAIRWAAKIV